MLKSGNKIIIICISNDRIFMKVPLEMSKNELNFENYSHTCYLKKGGECTPAPELMTIDEVIIFLRISEISKSANPHNVIKNLIRFRNLPRLQICTTILFPKQALLEWISKETIRN